MNPAILFLNYFFPPQIHLAKDDANGRIWLNYGFVIHGTPFAALLL